MKKITTILLLLGVSSVFAQSEKLNGQVGQGITLSGTGIVADPGFEAGTPNPAWTEASTNFGTPVCDEVGCGLGTGTGPNSGTFWTWFGGIASPEEGSMTQTISIPTAATVDLSFALETPLCAGTGFMEVLINSDQVFYVDETDPACDTVGYRTINVDISAYQGQTVDLQFHSVVVGDDTINIFIDDVDVTASGPAPAPASVPSLQWYGIFALLLMVGFLSRRKFQ